MLKQELANRIYDKLKRKILHENCKIRPENNTNNKHEHDLSHPAAFHV